MFLSFPISNIETKKVKMRAAVKRHLSSVACIKAASHTWFYSLFVGVYTSQRSANQQRIGEFPIRQLIEPSRSSGKTRLFATTFQENSTARYPVSEVGRAGIVLCARGIQTGIIDVHKKKKRKRVWV